MTGARPMGLMVEGTVAPRQHRLAGRCPDGLLCDLHVPCSQLCWRLEADEIQVELRAGAVLAGGRKVE